MSTELVKVPVLCYHAVTAEPEPGLEQWTTSPERFREHVDVISASGRTPLTISEFAECLRRTRKLDRGAVVVTFDDGYADTADAVRELLRHGIGSTVYLIAGRIGEPGMLSASEVLQLAALDGVELGAHTLSHVQVDELGGRALDEEIAGSKRAVEAVLDRPVMSFAYPHGSHDRRSREAVIRAGYSSAAAIKNAISHLEDDAFAIARWTVTADTSAERLAEVLAGERVPLAWRNERLRTRAHRAARRARRRLRALR